MSGFCHIPSVSQRHVWLSVVSRFFRFLTIALLLGWTIPLSANVFEATTPTSDFADNGDGTVTHKTTGLMWKRCSEGQTWSGGTCTGTAATYTWAQATALTSTFAGRSDWRLPNIRELQSIAEMEAYNPAINGAIFPNTPANSFWSASAWAINSSALHYVDFNYGYSSANDGSFNYNARLVRGGQSVGLLALSRPTTDYVDNGDGTVTHTPTALIWKRCAEGLTWSGSTCTGTATRYSWTAAAALTDTFAGKSDWRLPTLTELRSLVDFTLTNLAINSTIFPNTALSGFWSTSAFVGSSGHALGVAFNSGFDFTNLNSYNFYARLVRGGQSLGSSVSVSGLSLSCPSILNASATASCTATATYSDATTKPAAATWTSSSPTALTVNSATGSLTAGSPTSDTSVTITATYTEGGITQTATATVTVRAAALTGITLSSTSIYPTATATLSPTPSGAALGACSSGNTAIATVSGNTVIGVAAGTVTITCSGISTNLTVLPAALTGISLSIGNITVGGTTGIIASPSGASLPSCGSSNTSVATVSGSTVTGVAPGTATLTCGGYSASLTVTAPTLTGISLLPSTVVVGGTATLTPTPSSAGLGTCGSANPAVATVSGGTVTAVAVGNATIQCGGVTATLTVQAPALTGIALVSSTIYVGGLTTMVSTPPSAPLGSCTSSNPAVATVSGSAVTGVASGSAIITCSGVSTGITVLSLSNAPSGISLGNATLKVGGMTPIVPTPSSADLGSCRTGNPALASVSGGTVTALAVGSVAIVCGSVSATLTIQPPDLTAITLSPSSVAVGAVASINPVPSSALLGACSSGNASIATVSGNVVQAVAVGSAAITCGGVTAVVTVTPSAVLSSLEILCPGEMTANSTTLCTAQAVYSDAKKSTVTTGKWSVTPESAASVDASGKVTALKVTADTPIMVSVSYTENGKTINAASIINIKVAACKANTGEIVISGGTTRKFGDALNVSYRLCNFNKATFFDMYVAVQLPDKSLYFLQSAGKLFGEPSFSPQVMPYFANTMLPDMSGAVLNMNAVPLGLPSGTYTFYAIPVLAGGNVMNFVEWQGELARVDVNLGK